MMISTKLENCLIKIEDIGPQQYFNLKKINSGPMHITSEDIDFIRNLEERTIVTRINASHANLKDFENDTYREKLKVLSLQEALLDYKIHYH